MHNVFLSLGSNQGDRFLNISTALAMLEKRRIAIVQISPFYETAPWGFISDYTFINQVAQITTIHTPEELFRINREVEAELGRERDPEGHYRDRPIDIDILFFDRLILQTDELTIPHPRMAERRFILEPLACLAADFIHPVLHLPVKAMLSACNDQGLVALVNGSTVNEQV